MQVKIFIIIVVLFTSISILKSQESADQIAISELLKIDKMLDNHLAIIDRAIDDFQNDLDQVPRRFWEKQKKELKKEYDKSIESNLIKIYSSFLSREEVSEAIEYNKFKNASNFGDSYMDAYLKAMILGTELVAEISQNLSERIENSIFINNTISVEQFNEFRNGNFVREEINGIKVNIEMNDSIVVEKYRNKFIKHEIFYLNDCDYSLKIVETNDGNLQIDIGNSIDIYPYEVVGDTMKYRSMVMTEGGLIVKYGELTKSK